MRDVRRHCAFTLIELLTAIAIIAVLLAAAVFYTGQYVSYAKTTADKQTLTVLNDALTRYKCQGGDLTALTSGANVGNILNKLASPISWSGYQHQVLAKGVTYPARSLQGAGFRQSYRFTKYNSWGSAPEPGQDILDRLSSYGTPPDDTMKAWVSNALATTGSKNFLVLTQPSSSTTIGMTVTFSGTGYVNWGDGNTTTATNGYISHTYSTAANYSIIFVGDMTYLYSTYSDGRTAFGGDISTMTSLTYLQVYGSNTLTGPITGLTALTNLSITGSNTLSGSVSGLTGLTALYVQGSNTIGGSISGLPVLTNICVYGSNTLTGSVTGRSGMTVLIVYGSSTLAGSVTGYTGLTQLGLSNTSTVTGSVTGMTALNYLTVGGTNALTGEIAATALNYLQEDGSSTLTNPPDWNPYTAICFAYIKGLTTQAEVDNFLVAMDANKNATKPRANRTITCTRNCAAPSATGLAAKASLQAAGWTVTTN